MIQYQTFDQLYDEILDELELYDKNSLIEPSHLIPVVTKINKELGLRVTTTKEEIKPIENRTVRLPNRLEKINYVLYIGEKEVLINSTPSGIHKDYIEIDLLEETNLNKDVFVTDDGFVYETIITHSKPITYKYKIYKSLDLKPYSILKKTQDENNCYINKQHLQTSFEQGCIYINYEATLEDEEGNLLVVHHPLLLDYYKYAIKRRLLELLYLNGEEACLQKLQYIERPYLKAKQEANGVVDMPEFSEIKDIVSTNRKAMFQRYHSKFI